MGDRYLPIAFQGVTVLVPHSGSLQSAKDPTTKVKNWADADHYGLLGVPRHASGEEIGQAYREASRKYHPDKAIHLDDFGRREFERRMAALNGAHEVLSSPRQRWRYDRSLEPDPAEAAAAAAAAAAASAVPARPAAPPSDADPNADWDFDFSGDGRPYRYARGKASRVRGGRDGVRLARSQLRGKERMELVERAGALRHVGPLSPFTGMSVSGLLARPDVRPHFRDSIVGWVEEKVRNESDCWGAGGLRYASVGSGELLFDLELLELGGPEMGKQKWVS